MRKMNSLLFIVLALLMMSSCLKPNLKTSALKVKGNCEMCKATIEKSVKIKGVYSANWNVKTKILTISYDSTLVNLTSIDTNIANVGYDNELVKANDKTYNKLHGCCQYTR